MGCELCPLKEACDEAFPHVGERPPCISELLGELRKWHEAYKKAEEDSLTQMHSDLEKLDKETELRLSRAG